MGYMSDMQRETIEQNQIPTLKMLLKALPLVLLVFNKKGEIIEWNQECHRKTGFSGLKELNEATKSVRGFQSRHFSKSHINLNHNGEKNGFSCQIKLPRKNGKILTFSWHDLSDKFPILGWDQYGLGIDATDYLEQQRKLELMTSILQSPNISEFHNCENILPDNNDSKNFHEGMLHLLTSQERQILTHIGQGRTDKEISALQNLSHQTTRNYISRIFKKLNVSRRSEAVASYINILLATKEKMYSEIA